MAPLLDLPGGQHIVTHMANGDEILNTLREALKQPDITNPLDTKRTIAPASYTACVDALERVIERERDESARRAA